MGIAIRSAAAADAADLARIYNHYVAHTYASFETAPVTATDMSSRLAQVLGAPLPWLVAETAGRVVGYAYAARWKGRAAYRHSVESTVYLAADNVGKGVGLRLYVALIEALRTASAHTVIGGIALPNEPSVRLHEKLGFAKVAQFHQVGYKFDRWIDVGYWQLLL